MGIIMIAKVELSRKMNFSSFFMGRKGISTLLNYANLEAPQRSDFYFVEITAS